MKKLKFTDLLCFLLLSFIDNTYAAGTYDLSSKTLTIPLVTVGNTTFSNVVLKLNDFQVLQVDPNPLTGIVDGGFLMQFVSAVKQGKQVTVTMNITSQFKDRSGNIGNDGNYGCLANFTDDQGNPAYAPTSTQVGGTKAGHVQIYNFVADIPMTVSFTYDNVATNATSISLLNITIGNGGSIQLRNIPFQQPTTVSLQ